MGVSNDQCESGWTGRVQGPKEPDVDKQVLSEEAGQDQVRGEGAGTTEVHGLSQQVLPPDLPSASPPNSYL